MPQHVQERALVTPAAPVGPLISCIQPVTQNYFDIATDAPRSRRRSPHGHLSKGNQPPIAAALVQSVAPDYLAANRQPQPPSRSARWSAPSGTMSNWLLAGSWVGLGIPAIVCSIRALVPIFFQEATVLEAEGAASGELVANIVSAVIINTAALMLFSVLGEQTGRKLRRKHRHTERRY